jgi:hypothetical protein
MPALAQQYQTQDGQVNIHCCNLCNPTLQLQLGEDAALQGNTNWCLATCMNIVHQDILSKAGQLPFLPDFNQAGNIADFAKLAFIFSSVQNGVILPFQFDQPQDVEAIMHMRAFTAHLDFLPDSEEDIVSESQSFHERLKYLKPNKRQEIWDGSQYLHPLHPRLKELIPLNNGSVVEVFHQITNNPNFSQLNRAIFDGITNPWGEIFQDIWDNERVVIINTESIAGGIGHSVIAYAATQYTDGNQVISIHNPDTGHRSDISIASSPVVDIDGSAYQIFNYNIFNY